MLPYLIYNISYRLKYLETLYCSSDILSLVEIPKKSDSKMEAEGLLGSTFGIKFCEGKRRKQKLAARKVELWYSFTGYLSWPCGITENGLTLQSCLSWGNKIKGYLLEALPVTMIEGWESQSNVYSHSEHINYMISLKR